jgi:hypothetical protein
MRPLVFCGLALLAMAVACGGQSREERIQNAADRIVTGITAGTFFDCKDLDSSKYYYGTDSADSPLNDVPQEDWDDVGRLVEEGLRDYCAEQTQD